MLEVRYQPRAISHRTTSSTFGVELPPSLPFSPSPPGVVLPSGSDRPDARAQRSNSVRSNQPGLDSEETGEEELISTPDEESTSQGLSIPRSIQGQCFRPPSFRWTWMMAKEVPPTSHHTLTDRATSSSRVIDSACVRCLRLLANHCQERNTCLCHRRQQVWHQAYQRPLWSMPRLA